MKLKQLALWLTLTGGILFNFIFWNEGPGINCVILSVFILSALLVIDKTKFIQKENLLLAAIHLLSAVFLVWQKNEYGLFTWCFTLLLLGGSSQAVQWRSLLFVLPNAIVGYAMLPASAIKHFKQEDEKSRSSFFAFKWFGKFVKFGVIPVAILIGFTLIYQLANPVFNEMMQRFWKHFGDFIAHFFRYFSIERILFSILGMIVTGGIILYAGIQYFSKADLAKSNEHKRKPREKKSRYFITPDGQKIIRNYVKPFSFLGLKTENIMGIITLALLNGLLLLLNILDVQYVWMGNAYKVGAVDYSSLVHKGTGFLIAAILMSMVVLIFIFRGNLNYFKQSKTLKYLAYVWIIQNLFMVASVFMRDYFYIIHNGLTYKRIGVIVYLCMTAFGLITLIIKIAKTKTLYYLFRVNGWFGLFVLLALSSFNLDEHIATYNLSHNNTMDIDQTYLLQLGNAVLPVLYANENNFTTDSFRLQLLQYKKEEFIKTYKSHSWLSWNYSDSKTAGYFGIRK